MARDENESEALQSDPKVIIFNSASDHEASQKFGRWRHANKILGHYLNASPEYEWVLHRARCNHIAMPPGSDLARNETICGDGREAIERYAASTVSDIIVARPAIRNSTGFQPATDAAQSLFSFPRIAMRLIIAVGCRFGHS